MPFHLSCNVKNCEKEIKDIGYATICSHFFCEAHGIFLKRNWETVKCPACGSDFKNSGSIIDAKINPSEQFKALSLIGLKPSDVLEVATNSIKFWSYQCSQQAIMQKNKTEFYRNKYVQATTALKKEKQLHDAVVKELQQKLEDAHKRVRELNYELIGKEYVPRTSLNNRSVQQRKLPTSSFSLDKTLNFFPDFK